MANQTQGNGGGSLRGFAAMDRQRQREIASLGGRAAHEKGTAHEFTPEEARVAGRKGGEAVSGDRSHMAAIGRKGGENSRGGRRQNGNGAASERRDGAGGNATNGGDAPLGNG
jgi:uncharacterized protein